MCSATQWEMLAATTTSDRLCKDHTICVGTEYETKASGTHNDRVCASHTICAANQWQSKASGTHHDRECTGKRGLVVQILPQNARASYVSAKTAALQEEVRPPTCAKGATRLSSRKGSRVAVSRAARAGRAMKRKIL